MKIVEFANRVDSDEDAHSELPHQDTICPPVMLCYGAEDHGLDSFSGHPG